MEQRKTRKSAPQDVSEGSTPSKKTSSEKTQRPEVPAAVIGKLIVFTLLMIIAPLGSYFSTITYFYPGNTIAGAIAAVVVTNMVMALYVFVAFREAAQEDASSQAKKTT